jgi:hypothetical protein
LRVDSPADAGSNFAMTIAFRLKVLAFAAVFHATSHAVEGSGQPFGTIYASGGVPATVWPIVTVSTNGTVTPFSSGMNLNALAADSFGSLYASQGNTILKFAEDGTSSIFANLGGSFFPQSLAFSPSGVLYAASVTAGGSGIAAIAPNGAVSTFASGPYSAVTVSLNGEIFAAAGFAVERFNQEGISSPLATLNFIPSSMAATSSGVVYATGTMAGSQLVKILVDGSVSTVLTQPPSSVATDGFDTLFAGSDLSIVTVGDSGAQTPYANLGFTPNSIAVVVPEPSTYALLLMTGAGALRWARRRR